MDNKQEGLFREKVMNRINSPEDLNQYIRVTGPTVWMLLSVIAILLIGVCVWGVFGHMDTKRNVVVTSENQQMYCYVKADDISYMQENMVVTVDNGKSNETVTLGKIPSNPIVVSEDMNEYTLHVGELQIGEFVYVIPVNGVVKDGIYAGEIVIESVSPKSFVFN